MVKELHQLWEYKWVQEKFVFRENGKKCEYHHKSGEKIWSSWMRFRYKTHTIYYHRYVDFQNLSIVFVFIYWWTLFYLLILWDERTDSYLHGECSDIYFSWYLSYMCDISIYFRFYRNSIDNQFQMFIFTQLCSFHS